MKVSVSPHIIQQIDQMLQGIQFGSLEIYVVDGEVTQLTERRILKTNTKKVNGNGYHDGK